MNLNGYPVRISDTAGIRESSDTIEQEGVELALEQIRESNLNLLLIDVNDVEFKFDEKKIVPKDANKFTKINSTAMTDRTVILLNKSDTLNLSEQYNLKDFEFEWAGANYKIFEVLSCKENR